MKENDIIMLEKKLEFERIKNEKLKANQDYIAIMCDIDLEENDEQELRED